MDGARSGQSVATSPAPAELTATLLLPYRLRTVRIGILAQAAIVVMLLGVLLLGGGEAWDVGAYVAIAGAGGLALVGIAALPWRRIFEAGLGEAALYVWSVANIGLISLLVAATGGASSPMWGVYLLTTIFISASYRLRAQLVLHAVTVGAYAAALMGSGTFVVDRAFAARLTVLSVAAYMTSFLSRELMAQMSAHAHQRWLSDERARQIERIAEVSRDIHHLDSAVVLRQLVEAARDLGYDVAGVARLADGDIVVDEAIGLPPEFIGGRFPLAGSPFEDLPAARGAVILPVDPDRPFGQAGFATLIATPIRVAGVVTGVLAVAGRQPPSERDRRTVEPLELLAQIAGRALEHVSSLQQERDAVERLQRLDVLKRDFISNASHELRTPTTVIYGLLHTLVGRGDQLEPVAQQHILHRLLVASETLKDTITTLVDFARIETGQLTPRPVTVDLPTLVANVTVNLTEVLAEHSVSVDVAEHLSTDADPILLDRALENLLVNAARYTPPGTAIRIRGRREGAEIHLTVADDGPGIPPDEQPYLTDRFFRGGDPNTRTNRGLGLGLAFVGDVVAAHGGRLDVVSVPGAGSSFTLVLPVVRTPAGLPDGRAPDGRALRP